MRKLSTAEFIARSRLVHGDIYDYSGSQYRTSKDKVTIACPIHGDFEQEATSHLRGIGCPICGNKKRAKSKTSNTEKFINNAKAVHGDRYDYSLSNYRSAKQDIKILCPVHGAFLQKPTDHLSGKGCQICGCIKAGESRRLTTEEFLKKAKEVHGDKYDYSAVKYLTGEILLKIGCPEHGVFEQRAVYHLSGRGCSKCGREIVEESRRITGEEFIRRSQLVHGDLYDYSLVEFSGFDKDVTLICSEHGEFKQRPGNHLFGKGCIVCSGHKLKTTEEFIEQAKIIHNEKYDYSQSNYINSHTDVVIICPEHGEFKQRPSNHLFGKGCRKCTWGGYDCSKPGITYYARIDIAGSAYYKIGITNNTLQDRYNNTDLEKMTLIHQWEFSNGQEAFDLERLILKNNEKFLCRRVDILRSGNTEIFVKDVLSLDK